MPMAFSHCGSRGGGLPAVFNAANEVAVEAFINGEIEFTGIVEIVTRTTSLLDSIGDNVIRDLSDVSVIENDARQLALSLVLEIK